MTLDGSCRLGEQKRSELQVRLDALKTQSERNRLGQFATPYALAKQMLREAQRLLPAQKRITFLDPAVGTGAFFSALLDVFPRERLADACGFDVDPLYAEACRQVWQERGLRVATCDFTVQRPDRQYNLIVCNPPYVRHHHMPKAVKARLQADAKSVSGMVLNGLAGLYCYFVGLSHAWLAEDGLAVWLVPSEFMDVNYGAALRQYLTERVTLVRIHRFDPHDVQFSDALVSSAVIIFRNSAPPLEHSVTFTYGGSLDGPATVQTLSREALAKESRWSRLAFVPTGAICRPAIMSDFFRIRRGVATGDNDFFILREQEIRARSLPIELFRPVLPSPRHLPATEVLADAHGVPDLPCRFYLLDTHLNEKYLATRYPRLYAYLQEGRARGVDERYLCRHRDPWYAQELREPAPLLCTYLGRADGKGKRPFRFVLNQSRATVTNVYLAMYPIGYLKQALAGDEGLLRRVWEALNALATEDLLCESRVYGGGLRKLEPSELGRVDATPLLDIIGRENALPARQLQLLEKPTAARFGVQ